MSFTLTFSELDKVELPDPEWTDDISHDNRVMLHRMHGKAIQTFDVSGRIVERIWSFKFDALRQATRIALATFVRDHAGEPVDCEFVLERPDVDDTTVLDSSVMIISDEPEFVIDRFLCDATVTLDLLEM